MIDLRSDTCSLPTPEMREAMSRAVLGDETFGEDPTVRELEEVVTATFGFEAAMLGISATMCNLVALMTHCPAGSEVLLDRDVHVLRAEAGGIATIAGVVPTVVASERGHPTVAGVQEAFHLPTVVTPRPKLVWLENTHNRAGGTVMSVRDQTAVADLAHALDLRVHLDGARIFHAAAAQGKSLLEASRGADSLTIDFTKFLSCPLGAMLLGPKPFIDEARRRRRILGGGMRQAGVIGAPAIVALEGELANRAREEHRLARSLATAVAKIDGYSIEPAAVETNMAYVDVRALGTSSEVKGRLQAAGVLVSELAPWHIRLVVYRGITEDAISEAVARMRRVAGGRPSAEHWHRGQDRRQLQ